MKIHISEYTKSLLPNHSYDIIERGKIEVKGKGEMKTYFVIGKVDQDGNPIVCPFQKIMEEHRLKNGDAVDEFIVQEDKHAGFQALDQPVKVDRPPPPPAASKNTHFINFDRST